MQHTAPRSQTIITALTGAALAALLGACGGGGAGDTTTPETPPVTPPVASGSATGVLSDAPVQGVAYSTAPSGVTGTTDALGQYRYNPGDSVTFKLGALTLGSAAATATVTPVALAAGSAERLQNLLVLLQSLDANGLPADGIAIAAASAAAVSASIDLAQAPASFGSAANTALATAMAAGGISRAVTTPAAAQAHFLAQARALLAGHVWVGSYSDASGSGLFVQRFGANGDYLSAGINTGTGTAASGIESGTVQATLADGRGFQLAAQVPGGSTGADWSLAALSACERVRLTGDALVYDSAPASCVSDGSFTMRKADNNPTGIVGVWTGASADVVNTQTFVFTADGRYIMLDPEGDTVNHCGGPGIEYGSYTYDSATTQLRLSIQRDTNGCAGLSDTGTPGSFTLTLAANGRSGTFVAADGSFPITRVSN